MENFKSIPGYRQYIINEDGTIIKRIKSDTRIRTDQLKQHFHNSHGADYPNGYWYITLLTKDKLDINNNTYDSPGLYCVPIHRLVAFTYCENDDPISKIWVNHEDGVKINNHYTNLKWETPSYNHQHLHNELGHKAPSGEDHYLYGKTHSDDTKKLMSDKKKGILHPNFKGYYVISGIKYASSYEAAELTGENQRTIYNRCKKNPNENYYFLPLH